MHEHGESRLRDALLLTIIILVIEVVVGWRANSLALLSDAGHIVTDVFALGMAWFAQRLAHLPSDQRHTFGYQRSGILAALINAILLVLIGLAVAVEAVSRLHHPQTVSPLPVIAAAAAAIAVNAFIALRLHQSGQDNLNIRAALLHVVGDIAASIGVVISGLVILIWHANLADPIISLLIAVLIGIGAWRILRETVIILLEGTPGDVDLEKLALAMREVPGVEDVHDLHVWALSDGFRLLTAHVGVPDQSLVDAANLISDVKTLLRARFHIEHVTIELEALNQPRSGRPIYLERDKAQ
ncbi:MAG: cation diffusion facilitator family transporter [Chloroflexota bacterium]